MYNKRIKPDCIHINDPEARRKAREIVRITQGRFSADRGRWVRVDDKTLKFQTYSPSGIDFTHKEYK